MGISKSGCSKSITKSDLDSAYKQGFADCAKILDEYKKELQAFKDKQEQGLLLELPCKVGDTLYRIRDLGHLKDTCETDCYTCEKKCPYEGREYERVFDIVPWKMTSIAVIVNAIEHLGKTVFFTHSEAEEALAKMGGK